MDENTQARIAELEAKQQQLAENPDKRTPVAFRIDNDLYAKLLQHTIKKMKKGKAGDVSQVVNDMISHCLNDCLVY